MTKDFTDPSHRIHRLHVIADKCDDIAERFLPGTSGHTKSWLRAMGRELRDIAHHLEEHVTPPPPPPPHRPSTSDRSRK